MHNYDEDNIFSTELTPEEIQALEPSSRKSFSLCIGEVKSGVYKIVNDINDKIYVGSSKDLGGRWKGHIYNLFRGKHNSKHLQNFFNKHKEIHFRMELLEACEAPLSKREQLYLDTLKPFGKKGFNICKRAYAPPSPTQKSKKKISKSRTIGFAQYTLDGKLLKIHRSRAQLAKEMGIEKTNLNKACNTLQTYKGYIWKYDSPNLPEQIPQDELDKLSGRLQKRISGYSEQGELVATYKNAIQFSKKTGWDRKYIKKICAKEIPKFKGLYWYLE